MHSLDACVPEKGKRRLVETDCYLRYPPLEVFAGTQVERDTCPTPVIYLQLAGDVGLGIRIRSYVRPLGISPEGIARDGAGMAVAARWPNSSPGQKSSRSRLDAIVRLFP